MLAYIAEFIILALMGAMAACFWSIRKAPRHFSKMLTDENGLRKLLLGENGELLINKFENDSNLPGDYFSKKIEVILKAPQTEYIKIRNVCLIIAILLIGGSFFLGNIYLALNIFVFFYLSTLGVIEPLQKRLDADIISLATGITKWNTINPADCSEYCGASSELKLLHQLVTTPA